jgi:hypothetical protein
MGHMTRNLRVLLIALFPVISFGQIKDVFGWGKVQWGMTISQAKLVLGRQASEPTAEEKEKFPDWPPRMAMRNVEFAEDVRGDAVLLSRKNSNLITAVHLNIGKFEDKSAKRELAFARLKDLLLSKYGSPKSEEPNELIWAFPSTVVKLWRIETGVGLGFVGVDYDAVDKKVSGRL